MWGSVMDKRTRYYHTFTDDFFQAGETHPLPENYEWVRQDRKSRFLSALIYGLALVFSTVYCRLWLHMRIKGARRLRQAGGGFFLFANHTQPIGDVFHPALACFPKRIYTVVSPANLALPGIGKILPYLGALPIPDSLHGMRAFNKAVEKRVGDGHPVIIYPEAHLWEYYTGIRPFPDTAFKFPVSLAQPTYCMTTTYQKRRFGKKPRITIFVDGPFAAAGKTAKEKAAALHDAVYTCMKERAQNSTYAYISYTPYSS